MKKSLSLEQVTEARYLRKQGKSKRELARMFKVSPTTIWENVFTNKKRKRIFIYKKFEPRTGNQCPVCEVFLTREIKYPHIVPLNYQILNMCIGCYLNKNGLKYKDLL